MTFSPLLVPTLSTTTSATNVSKGFDTLAELIAEKWNNHVHDMLEQKGLQHFISQGLVPKGMDEDEVFNFINSYDPEIYKMGGHTLDELGIPEHHELMSYVSPDSARDILHQAGF